MQSLDFKNAFVLHSRPYKENQAIIELLVEGEGRVSVVGSLGSKKNSTRNALLSPFRPIKVQIKPGKSLHGLKGVESNSQLEVVYLKQQALFCGFYLNEVICRLCQSDEFYDELYPLYIYALSHLNSASTWANEKQQKLYIELILRQFEARLLLLLGYGISFEQDIELGTDINPNMYYELLNHTGFVMTNLAQRGVLGRDLLAINKLLEKDINLENVSPVHLKQCKAILRTCLHRQLGDKPLKSRELFRK